jgi:phosphoenolpyruvate phosphomutase
LLINEGARRGELWIGLLTDAAIAAHKRLPFLNYEQRKQAIEHIKGVSQVEYLRKTGVISRICVSINRI